MINAFLAIRMGSTRVPYKNFRELGGKPLFTYLTDEAKCSEEIDNLFINTDNSLVIDITKRFYGESLQYYLRPKELGTSNATLDEYVYDFMIKHPSETTIFLNPCSPFLRSSTIDSAIRHFKENNLNSCAASEQIQTHCFLRNHPLNFSFKNKQPRSQDLKPIHAMTSGFFIWKNSSFLKAYEEFGFGNFHGNFYSFPVSSIEATDIDSQEDFEAAERILLKSKINTPKYVDEVQLLVNNNIKLSN